MSLYQQFKAEGKSFIQDISKFFELEVHEILNNCLKIQELISQMSSFGDKVLN
jgi:hypothetical protein